jgi:D-glycero-D-manno-heptose 1,7-bisphosphate phosphatase
VETLHAALRVQLPIDEFRVCYHDDADHCGCRKPKPGLLVDAACEHGIDLLASYLIGDRWRDVAAGQAVGCMCLFIDYGYTETQPAQPFVRSLTVGEAVAWILAQN